MAKVKKGKARIGSSKKDAYRGFEGVEQRVQVDAYCVDRYEYPGKGRAPMTGITYKQAQALCGARSLRLCTDREWERACKGPRGYRYPYGSKFNADRCVTEDRQETPRALQSGGSFKRCKSGYGVYDMSGNAAEWSSEGHLRGGTATKPDYAVRCAHKVKKNRAAKDPFVGFRCCADAK
jgi:formylglycine-generating enzyme required for sulfatase activity